MSREQENCASSVPKNQQIALLNDILRQHGIGGAIGVTKSVTSLPDYNVDDLLRLLVTYDEFGSDNDPYGERDFGSFEYLGHKLFWKIDYYGKDMVSSSPNPADPSVTERLLTVMLAEDY